MLVLCVSFYHLYQLQYLFVLKKKFKCCYCYVVLINVTNLIILVEIAFYAPVNFFSIQAVSTRGRYIRIFDTWTYISPSSLFFSFWLETSYIVVNTRWFYGSTLISTLCICVQYVEYFFSFSFSHLRCPLLNTFFIKTGIIYFLKTLVDTVILFGACPKKTNSTCPSCFNATLTYFFAVTYCQMRVIML